MHLRRLPAGPALNPVVVLPVRADQEKGWIVDAEEKWLVSLRVRGPVEWANLIVAALNANVPTPLSETRAPELAGTETNADYWAAAAHRASDPAEALIFLEQARNAWRNAAYAMRDRYRPAVLLLLSHALDDGFFHGDPMNQRIVDFLKAALAAEPPEGKFNDLIEKVIK